MSASLMHAPCVLMAADASSSLDTGLGRHQTFLARELVRLGFVVKEITSESVASGKPGALRRFQFPLAVLREALRGFSRGRAYDLVFVHEGSAAAVCLARRMGLLGARCAVVSHNTEQKVWELNLARAARGELDIKLSSRWIWPLTRLSQSNFALKYGDVVLTLSEEDVQFISRRFGRSTESIQRIANGVEERFFESTCTYDTPRILFLGTWLPHKGTRELRSALCAVLEKHPKAVASLVGLGIDQESVKQEFPAALRGRIRLQRHVAPGDLPSVFAEHNIFVLPSWFEGLPLSLLEAMASGLAVVVTPVGGMREVVRNEVDGLCADASGDSASLAALLNRLCSDPTLRERLGIAARERAREYTWAKAGEALAWILRDLLGDQFSARVDASPVSNPKATSYQP